MQVIDKQRMTMPTLPCMFAQMGMIGLQFGMVMRNIGRIMGRPEPKCQKQP